MATTPPSLNKSLHKLFKTPTLGYTYGLSTSPGNNGGLHYHFLISALQIYIDYYIVPLLTMGDFTITI